MDEPFGSLDATTKERLQVELTELWEKTKKTVLFITHDLEEALFLGDRVAVMQSIAADVPIKIFEVPFSRPRNKFLREDACFQEMRRRLLGGVVAPMNKRRGEVPRLRAIQKPNSFWRTALGVEHHHPLHFLD